MSLLHKRLFFWSLFIAFGIYTVVVFTDDAGDDMGAEYFTQEAANGKLLYQKYNCTACHQLYGLGGYMGPDLTNVMSANGRGEFIVRAFLKSGTQKMPNFNLTDDEINDLVAYLSYVDKSGISPVRDFSINADGTVEVFSNGAKE
ncbi:MAG: Nitric oxide reductase subunit C [Bacteroidia bacterium]|nr:Nitric oxide reductase subunit C [Bacteroidia bacterium]